VTESADGSRYVVGFSPPSDSGHVLIAKIAKNNQLDQTFGSGGTEILSAAFGDQESAIAIGSNHTLIIVADAYAQPGFQNSSGEIFRVVLS